MQETVLAVDLGGTKLLVGEINQQGHIFATNYYASDVSSQRAAITQIKFAIQDFLTNTKLVGKIIGISLAIVGRVDEDSGIWFELSPGNSDSIELAKELENFFTLPCIINNDVTSATYAESYLGIGKQTKNFVYLNVGTGIAARIVTNGSLIHGNSFNAGEVGHMVVDMNMKRKCACGRVGCVETFASGLGMSHQIEEWLPDFPESLLARAEMPKRYYTQEIFEAAEKGDDLAEKVLKRAVQGISELIMNLVRVSDTEAVILGGGVMNNQFFFHQIVTRLNKKTIRFVKKGIHQTSLDINQITLIGAGIRGFDKLQQEEKKRAKLRA
ncbi:ROK family protein [Enterococcus sp. DIV0660C]|uniref:ROK family protein n=1 Tax=Enterococcus sp. DIV0660C TaxID=2230880 RepID=UPI001A8FACD5|nr:ROK family protein [Enterococcus sp. DIV0660C]MBO0431149.1 ROK family protein [Enterococcus sp. DIV0660C]